MYKYVAHARNALKRDRIRIEDLSDDLESPNVKRRNQTEAEAKEEKPKEDGEIERHKDPISCKFNIQKQKS